MKTYLDLLKHILENGTRKGGARENMPNTIGVSGYTIRHNMSDGFPLLTTKKVSLKNIFIELKWMLNGGTNIKFLVDNNVNIWNDDAYRWYKTFFKHLSIPNYNYGKLVGNSFVTFTEDEFLNKIKENLLGDRNDYKLGDLGKIYGYQWRNQGGTDQLAELLSSLKLQPNSRRHIINGWNAGDLKDMALPPCHVLYQFIVNGNKLDLIMYQRSADVALGVPYNLAAMGLLLTIVANYINMVPGEIVWNGGDVHIYQDQVYAVKEQLKRLPRKLPNISIKSVKNLNDILTLSYDDISVKDYNPYDAIKIKLSTGK